MKRYLLTAMAAVISVLTPCTHTHAAKTPRTNIILIMADDLGYETIGANGGTSYKTPGLDKLACEGMRFEHCYSQPLCTPSRVQIMTGRYNSRNYVNFGYLDVKATTFAHLLKQAGYATCIVGKWQLNGKGNQTDLPPMIRPKHFGFDEWCLWQLADSGRVKVKGKTVDARYDAPLLNINGEDTGVMKDRYGPEECLKFTLDFIKRNKDRPFLVYYPMILTHCPFWPTPSSDCWKDPKARKPGHFYKGDAKYFGDMVSYMDGIVNRIAAGVDELGLGEQTLIIFTGDNGTDKPVVSMCNGRKVVGQKGSLTDGGTRVPLIARWTGHTPAGKVSNDLVDFSDMLPTMLDVAGVPSPTDLPLDGRSFAPQLRGEKGNPRDWIYCWYFRGGKPGKGGGEWARTQRYKLYKDGRLFDVANDVLEKSPLDGDAITPEVAKVRDMLGNAIDSCTRPGFYNPAYESD